MLTLLLGAPSLAATLTVSSSGTYTTIQSAVDAASSGDTIAISAGSYTECVDLGGLDLTLTGDGSSSTDLDGGGCSAGALSLTGGETAEVTGLTITNSSQTAVFVESSILSMDDVVIENSGSGTFGIDGGALHASDSTIDLTDVTFDGNSGYYGGAVFIESDTSLVASDVTFSSNDAQFGGGISAETGSTVALTDCTFTDNVVSVSGYGKGGALYAYYEVDVTIDTSTFTDNDSATFGGAISMETYGSLAVTDSTFHSNEILTGLANPSSGGAIYLYSLDALSITGSDFTDNVGYFYGGAVFANNMNDESTISNSTFSGNSIQSKRGGAVEFSAGSDLVVSECTFTDNIAAEAGGALSVYQNNDLTVSDSTFSGNSNTSTRDAHGGAIFAFDDDNSADLTITDCTIEDNTAALSGGGLYVGGMGAVSISGTTFNNNEASGVTNSSYYNGGAANFYDLTELTMASIDACGNTADYGGGFFLEDVPLVSWKNTALIENTASQEGGSGYFTGADELLMENNTFLSGTGGSLYFAQSAVEFTNNVVAYTVDNYGVYAADSATATDSDFTYSDWYDNGSADTDGSFSFSTSSDGNITDEPDFMDYSEDGDCSNDDISPASGSPLIDAGDPTLLDPDGSDSDIGAYGGPDSTVTDADEDGYYSNTDCDDDDGATYPGATEYCDGEDNDCDGEVDVGVVDGSAYYDDGDGDGYGDPDDGNTFCSQPSGYVADDTDCDDTNSNVSPDGTEICDGIDNDCDGTIDGEDASDVTTWYLDYDGDGYGGSTYTEVACDQPSGYVDNDDDCDDGDSTISPDADESCDGADNDCDGDTDEDDAIDAATWYIDFDGDGFGVATFTTDSCDEPSGYTDNTDDCDDTDSAINPDADEVCDGQDNDCDSTTDEPDALDAGTWHDDTDGDGYGDPDAATIDCDQPSGTVADNTDCDDSAAESYPGADEVCDEEDNDCNGLVDDGSADVLTFYADFDGDGYGDPGSAVQECEAPGGYVENAEDCDDGVSYSYPGASEVCDGQDNDCDGTIDEDALDVLTWYADTDGDGYGDLNNTTESCDEPSGYTADGSDCDDTSAEALPGGTEVAYDGLDNDCDGGDLTDADGDGFDSDIVGGADCNDSDPDINPDENDIADDGVDQDCDGTDPTELEETETDPDKGTCSHVGAGDAGAWALLALVGLLRRRKVKS